MQAVIYLLLLSALGAMAGMFLKGRLLRRDLEDLSSESVELKDAINFQQGQIRSLPTPNALKQARARLTKAEGTPSEVGKKSRVLTTTDLVGEEFVLLEAQVSEMAIIMEENGLDLVRMTSAEGIPAGSAVTFRSLEARGEFEEIYLALAGLRDLPTLVIQSVDIKQHPTDGDLVFSFSYTFTKKES